MGLFEWSLIGIALLLALIFGVEWYAARLVDKLFERWGK